MWKRRPSLVSILLVTTRWAVLAEAILQLINVNEKVRPRDAGGSTAGYLTEKTEVSGFSDSGYDLICHDRPSCKPVMLFQQILFLIGVVQTAGMLFGIFK